MRSTEGRFAQQLARRRSAIDPNRLFVLVAQEGIRRRVAFGWSGLMSPRSQSRSPSLDRRPKTSTERSCKRSLRACPVVQLPETLLELTAQSAAQGIDRGWGSFPRGRTSVLRVEGLFVAHHGIERMNHPARHRDDGDLLGPPFGEFLIPLTERALRCDSYVGPGGLNEKRSHL